MPTDDEDYNDKKVPELKSLLKDRNLSVTGTKPELISRLEEDDEKNANEFLNSITQEFGEETADKLTDWSESPVSESETLRIGLLGIMKMLGGDEKKAQELYNFVKPDLAEDIVDKIQFDKISLDPLNYRFSDWLASPSRGQPTKTNKDRMTFPDLTNSQIQSEILNVMKQEKTKVNDLSRMIQSNGFQVQFPLVVAPYPDPDKGKAASKFIVLDGNRRYTALHILLDKINEDGFRANKVLLEHHEKKSEPFSKFVTKLLKDDKCLKSDNDKGGYSYVLDNILKILFEVPCVIKHWKADDKEDLHRLRGEVQAYHHLSGQLGWDGFSQAVALEALLDAHGLETDPDSAYVEVSKKVGLDIKPMKSEINALKHHRKCKEHSELDVTNEHFGWSKELFFKDRGHDSKIVRTWCNIPAGGFWPPDDDNDNHEFLIKKFKWAKEESDREIMAQSKASPGEADFRHFVRILKDHNLRTTDNEDATTFLTRWMDDQVTLIDAVGGLGIPKKDWLPSAKALSKDDGPLSLLISSVDQRRSVKGTERQNVLKKLRDKSTQAWRSVEDFTEDAADQLEHDISSAEISTEVDGITEKIAGKLVTAGYNLGTLSSLTKPNLKNILKSDADETYRILVEEGIIEKTEQNSD